jgi:hypothetical protein
MTKGKNARKRLLRSGEQTREKFKAVTIYGTTTSAGVTVYTQNLSLANLSQRMSIMDQLFKKWRHSGPLRVRAWVDSVPVLQNSGAGYDNFGCTFAAAYLGSFLTNETSPTSINDLAEMVHSTISTPPVMGRFTVPLADLRAQQAAPWLSTNPSNVTASEASSGVLYAAVSLQTAVSIGSRIWIELSGELEFMDPTDPDVTLTHRADALSRSPTRIEEKKEPDVSSKASLRSRLISGRLSSSDERDLLVLMRRLWKDPPNPSDDDIEEFTDFSAPHAPHE